MRAFSRLIKTELRDRRNALVVSLTVIAIIQAALAVLTATLSVPGALDLIRTLNSGVLLCGFLLPLIRCFTTWIEEWKQHSIYKLMILPVSRLHLIAAKYIAIMLELLLILAVIIAGFTIQNTIADGSMFRSEPLLAFDWPKLLLLVRWLLAATSIILLSFFSVFIGKWQGAFSVPITFISFIAGLFVLTGISSVLPSLFTFLAADVLLAYGSLYLLDKKVGVA
ncbi:ABC transporter permease [Paenibacillus ginsengarvi]|uniref:Uncharacterized protein n=1 Tax=Paenibacillus ginsengarvi TaxID=400777 RepID=A0A3B0CL61_9BACL|nr:ABC transporter permease [Paenibacillus ginsengarvi]RKN86415.1 hypothetical protein D7M11_00125 [Paenibacillus ginsengarvi]